MNTDIECRLTGPEKPECFQLRIGDQIHDLHAWQLITLVEAVNLAWLHWLGLTRIDIIKSYLELDQREKLSTVISEQAGTYGLALSRREECDGMTSTNQSLSQPLEKQHPIN